MTPKGIIASYAIFKNNAYRDKFYWFIFLLKLLQSIFNSMLSKDLTIGDRGKECENPTYHS